MVMTTSYNGWPASDDPHAIGINKDWAPLGHKFPGGCKAGDVETVFTYFVEQLDARAEPIDRDAIKDEWGWFFKHSANSPKLISCHSSGTAFDYNATRHPNGKRNTWAPEAVIRIRKIQAECSGVVHWLGDATHTPDEMHFEIMGTAADVAAAAKHLHHPNPNPPDFQEDDMLRLLICNPNRDDWPEIKGHWYKSDGLTAEHVPTAGHATALKGLGLLHEDTPIPVSPSLLRELGAVPPTS